MTLAKGLVLAFVLLAAWVLAQVALVHATKTARVFRAMTIAFVPAAPLFLILFFATPTDLGFLPERLARSPPALGIASGLVLLVLGWGAWVQLYFALDRSVTLRLLLELSLAKDAVFTEPQVRAAYGLDRMIGRRLEILESSGHIAKDGERFVLTAKGRPFARLFALARRISGAAHYLDASLGSGPASRTPRSG